MSDEQSVQEESLDPFSLFPPEIRRAVEGLAYLGQLTDSVAFCGHTFVLRTLKPYHEMAIAQALQPYRNTIYEVDVFQHLHVGLALTEVDGNPNFCPQAGPDNVAFANARLRYLTDDTTGWYRPTLDFLWQRYALLEALAAKAVEELDRLSSRGQPTSLQPWLDSLIVQGSSPAPTSSETPPHTSSS